MKGRHSGKGPSKGPARGGQGSKPLGRGGRDNRQHGGRPGGGRSQRASHQESGGKDRARWVVGIHSCHETLRVRPKAVRELWLHEDYEESQQLMELAELAQSFRIQIRTKSPGQLEAVGSGHQGIALAVTEDPKLDWDRLAGEGKFILLALDGIEDPHNLGSILRTAWLTGVAGILIPDDRAVGLTPAACKVASGGAEHVPVETCANLPSELQKLKDSGFWIYGLSEKGTRKPWEFNLADKVIWVIGSEGSGMRVTTERACDELVRIPQVSTGSSYNASVAAAMALTETCRQFGNPE